jgi:hypothetical protein
MPYNDQQSLANLLRGGGGITETMIGQANLHPDVQKAIALGKIPAYMGQFYHDLHTTPGDKRVETGRDQRGISQQQENYNQRIKAGEVNPKFYEKGAATRLNIGASSDANVYPAMGNYNYMQELQQAIQKDPTYMLYQEELNKFK